MIVHVYGHKIFTLIKDWLMCVLYRAVGPVFRYWSADLKRIFSNILADCSGISHAETRLVCESDQCCDTALKKILSCD